jgi:hypothetical protein
MAVNNTADRAAERKAARVAKRDARRQARYDRGSDKLKARIDAAKEKKAARTAARNERIATRKRTLATKKAEKGTFAGMKEKRNWSGYSKADKHFFKINAQQRGMTLKDYYKKYVPIRGK